MARALPRTAELAVGDPISLRADFVNNSAQPATMLTENQVDHWVADRVEIADPSLSTMASDDWFQQVESALVVGHANGSTAASGRGFRTFQSSGSTVDWERIRVEPRHGLLFVSLRDSRLVKDSLLDELRAELLQVANVGCPRVVLDLSNLIQVASRFLAALVTLQDRLHRQPGGRLKLCSLSPQINQVFEVSGLKPLFEITEDLRIAWKGPWPKSEPNAIPIAILSDLTRPASEDHSTQEGAGSGPVEELIEIPKATNVSASLILYRDSERLGTVPVLEKGVRIGRGSSNEVRIRNRFMSRHHAWIGYRHQGFILEDLNSTNGTAINDRLLKGGSTPLSIGMSFRIGSYRFELAGPETVLVDSIVDDWGDQSVDNEPPTVDEFALDLAKPAVSDPRIIKSEIIEDALVIAPTQPQLNDTEALDRFRAELIRQLDADNTPNHVVLNLASVSMLTSKAIGVLVGHQLRLQQRGGLLRIAQPLPQVSTTLKVMNIAMLIEVHPTLEGAVLASWSAV